MFSKNIKYLRESRGWSQEDLADRLGYKSFTTIAKWESSVAEPPLKTIKQLATLFNVPVTNLVNSNLSEPQTHYIDDDVAEMAQKLKDNEGMRVLFNASKDMSKEDMDFVVKFIEKLKKD